MAWPALTIGQELITSLPPAPPVESYSIELDSTSFDQLMLGANANCDFGLGEGIDIQTGATDYAITMCFQVQQVCASGGAFTLWRYHTIDGVETLDKKDSYGFLATLVLVKGTTTVFPGPNESVSFKVTRQAQGAFCNSTKSFTITGKTGLLKPPTNLTATTNGSDRNVVLTWSKGTSIPDLYSGSSSYQISYWIYKNGQFFASTNARSYTAQTTPGTTDRWEVRTRFNGYSTNPAQSSAPSNAVTTTTAPYKAPTNFIASDDTTVGYVRLSWSNPSDYATHTRIYRDQALIATVAKSQTSYLDAGAQPGVTHNYSVTSYNSSSGLESGAVNNAGRAFLFAAADGGLNDRVRIQWTNFSDPNFAAEVRIKRDDDELGVFTASQSTYDDRDALPGKIHRYSITALDENRKPVLAAIDYGFRPANGQIRGTVKTPGATTGGGVKDVLVSAWPTTDTLSSALALDGVNDYVSVRHEPRLSLTGNLTIEFWVKFSALPPASAPFVLINKRINNSNATLNYQVQLAGDRTFRFYTGGAANNVRSTTLATTGVWYHIASVQETSSGQIKIYINGQLESAANVTAADLTNEGALLIGRDEVGRFTNGMMDDIRLWKIARSDSAIGADRYRLLKGDEAGLVAYWPFNTRTGNAAGDYAKNGGHHGEVLGGATWSSDQPKMNYSALTDNRGEGAYKIDGLYYSTKSEFAIAPFRDGHGFVDPDTLYRTLENTPPDGWIATANFIDTTSFSISGKIAFFSEPTCGAAGVQILVDGVIAGVTDASGNFSVAVPQAGQYKIKPVLRNHTFDPVEMNLAVTRNINNLLFLDRKTITLSGKVSGGCDNFLGAASISINSLDPNNCFAKVITTNNQGQYTITLPAQKYALKLASIANPNSAAILAYFKTDTLDLTFSDSTFNYVYHSPPQIRVTGPYAAGCNEFAGVPIMRQFRSDTLTIEVFEEYEFNGQKTSCAVDSGAVVFDNRIADDAPATMIVLKNGKAQYVVTPGVPNILRDNAAHPYQKWMKMTAKVERYSKIDTLWALVTGHKPRPGEPFSTASPQLPLMILRDPPGDQSYGFLEKERKEFLNIGLSFGVDASLKVFSEAKVGAGFDIPFVGSGGAFARLSKSLEVGASIQTDATVGLEIINRERLNTSNAEEITGNRGDVFIGGAINIKYGITDALSYTNCGVVLDEKLVWGGDGFATRYMYTESYVRESLIPELKYLADNAAASDKAARFLDAIEVWQQVLALNDKLKREAPVVKPNISFSGNLGVEESETVTHSLNAGIEFNLYIEETVAASAGVTVGEFNAAEAGVQVRARLEVGASLAAGISTSNTIGYYLGDDDAGDDFTLNLKGDPVFGTPVFDLLGGTSSNPWEGLPSQPRDGLQLSIDRTEQNNIPPATPAIFKLRLFNTSPTNETREYMLSLIQSSNPGGARVRSGDQFVEKLRYTIPPRSFQEVTLDVSRLQGHPYEYENLQVRLFAERDPQFADTVAFSARFIKPCSEIALVQPAAGWSITQVRDERIGVVLANYDAADPNLSLIKLQYSEDDVNWFTITEFPRSALPLDTLKYFWDTSRRPNGAYLLRAAAVCNSGENYSIAAKGFIDRSSWTVSLRLADAGGLGRTENLSFGQSSMASAGLDLALGESELPPAPPAGVFYAGFTLPTQTSLASLADFRHSDALNVTWNLAFQPGAGGYPMMFNWNPAALPAGEFHLRDDITGEIVDVDLKAQNSYLLTNSAVTSLSIEFISSYQCQQVPVAAGWNIISVPLEANDMFKNKIFPAATSKAFSFDSGYNAEDLLRSGVGYWLKFDKADTVEICGREATPLEIPVQQGWNIIGPFDDDVPINAITTIPAGIITSQFFGYNAGYAVANTLQSGRGYWVQVSQNGIIKLNTGAGLAKSSGAPMVSAAGVEPSWGRMIITDSRNQRTILYAASSEIDAVAFALPPAPPAGIFDARFAAGTYVANIAKAPADIVLSSAAFPVKITAEGLCLRVSDKITGELLNGVINANSSIELTDPNLTRIAVQQEAAVPEKFALFQNYPNPFNPNTTIKFNLPQAGRVQLTIYNVLGERVAELLDKQLEAGSHTFAFDASRLASGIYFYRLQAGKDFVAVKKMLLAK